MTVEEMSLVDQVSFWRDEAAHLESIVQAYQHAAESTKPCTLFEFVEAIALGRHGCKIQPPDLESALDFMATSGFLTAEQYQTFRDDRTRFIPGVLDNWLIDLITEKAVVACRGEALAVSPEGYAILGMVASYAVAHAQFADKCLEANQWRMAYQTLRIQS